MKGGSIVPLVLRQEMHIVTSDNKRALHTELLHNAAENAPTDGNITCEWAFVVDIPALNCLTWHLEPKARRFPEAGTTFSTGGLAALSTALSGPTLRCGKAFQPN